MLRLDQHAIWTGGRISSDVHSYSPFNHPRPRETLTHLSTSTWLASLTRDLEASLRMRGLSNSHMHAHILTLTLLQTASKPAWGSAWTPRRRADQPYSLPHQPAPRHPFGEHIPLPLSPTPPILLSITSIDALKWSIRHRGPRFAQADVVDVGSAHTPGPATRTTYPMALVDTVASSRGIRAMKLKLYFFLHFRREEDQLPLHLSTPLNRQ